MSAPPMSGPAMAPPVKTVMFRAFAAGSISCGTIRGSTAERVGWLMPKQACWIEKIDSSSQTLVLPSAACRKKRNEVTIRPHVVKVSSRRRSKWSASEPP